MKKVNDAAEKATLREQRLLTLKGMEGDIARCREAILEIPSPNHSVAFTKKIEALLALSAVEKSFKEYKRMERGRKRKESTEKELEDDNM